MLLHYRTRVLFFHTEQKHNKTKKTKLKVKKQKKIASFFDSVHQDRLLLLVGVRVLDHPVLPDESLAAHVAGERLLAGVETHVAPEVSLVVELLGADVALVRLVAGMFREVLLERK